MQPDELHVAHGCRGPNVAERPKVARSFTDEQMSAIRRAYVDAERWNGHSVDVRGTTGPAHGRWYFTFVAGRNRRSMQRQSAVIPQKLRSIVDGTITSVSLVLLAGVLVFGMAV